MLDITYLYINRLCYNKNMTQRGNLIIIKNFHDAISYYLIDERFGNITYIGNKMFERP